ncbi:MAG: fibronectin type III domain-containing protein [Acidobacteria bacterium]|nr:fibronectin type III domain-containing protein [Acidobacteriota bacterium]
MTPVPEPRGRRLLLLVLAAQLLCADVLRWPLTTSTIKTNMEYLLGQEVIASENWRHDGALARHFIPSRSIDQNLPEWWYRDVYWRDYLSQPPLSWMLHYWASRALDRVDPIIVGKLLAQGMTVAGVLIAAPLLEVVFGFGAALAGLSFVIWSSPFLVWFIDGYYSTTPAMLCQLVLASWGVAFFTRTLSRNAPDDGSGIRARDLLIASSLAYLGTLSEWVALFGNAVAVAAFAALGAVLLASRQTSRAWKSFTVAAAIAVGSAAAEITTVLMYGTRIGFEFYFRGFMDRVNERTGDTPIGPYTGVLIRQLETAWPRWMLIVMSVMLVVATAYAVLRLWRDGRDAARGDGVLLLLAIVLGFGSGVTYCYRLTNLVTIHWWFTGTWVVGWAMTICAFVDVVRRIVGRLPDARLASAGYPVFCAALWAGVCGWNLSFVDLTPPPGAASHDLYRSLAGMLPRDGAPLVVADMPGLFGEYPFPTAYLRRPIVRFETPGWPVKPKLVKLSTDEDAGPALLARGGFTYLAYDPWQHRCTHEDATPRGWSPLVPLAICRVGVEPLVRDSAGLFREDATGAAAAFARWVNATIDAGDSPRALLTATKLLDASFRTSGSLAIDGLRRQHAGALRRFVETWRRTTRSGTDHTVAVPGAPALTGILADRNAWYLLFSNVDGRRIPEASPGVRLLVNGQARAITSAYQNTTEDGASALPFSLMTIPPIPGLPDGDVQLELVDAGASATSRSRARVVRVPDGDAGRGTLGQAQALLEGRCSAPPGAPQEFRIVSNQRRVVTLAWSAARGGPTSYVLQAGHAPGGSDVPETTIGNLLTVTISGVAPGTYYARLRGRNACGLGAASNEIVAVVP